MKPSPALPHVIDAVFRRSKNAKYADYIEQIEIDSLWSGKHHVVWNLDRQVNILSGINGVGKSTILNKVVRGLVAGGEFANHMLKGVRNILIIR